MKVEKRGNVYRKAGWLKEHESEILSVLCFLTVMAGAVALLLGD